MKGLFFEELETGASYRTGRVTVTEDAIICFAHEWDPQPFHIDRIAAQESIFGGLVGSGLQTLMLTYRLYYDHGLIKETAVAGLGFEALNFHAPLRPGDTIRVLVKVLDKRLSRHPGRGVVRIGLTTLNQDETTILSLSLNALVACRIAG